MNNESGRTAARNRTDRNPAKTVFLIVVLIITAAAVGLCIFKARFCAASEDGGQLLDLRGCNVSDERFAELTGRYPDVELLCEVQLGKQTVRSDITMLTLTDEDEADCEQLIAAAPRFIKLSSIDLSGMTLSAEQYEAVCAAYPHIHVKWLIPAAGGLESSVKTLTINDMEMFRQVIALKSYLPALESIDMTGFVAGDAESRELLDCMATYGLDIKWSVSVCGQHLPRDATSVTLTGEAVTDLSELSRLPKLDDLTLDGIGTGDLSPLASMDTLLGLVVRDTQIQDVTVLSGMTQLQSCLFDNAGVTRQQLNELQRALPDCIIMNL